MNKYLTILIVSIAILSSQAQASADNAPTYTVCVSQSSEPDKVDDGPVRQRMPSRPVICTISPDRVFIPSVNSDDILSYEVYDSEGSCMASFTSEADFIFFIYDTEGTVEIRIHVDGYVFHGFIDL